MRDILILEDSEERNKLFRSGLEGLDIDIVDNADECISRLKEYRWKALFLDHDLGGKVHVSVGDTNTGSEVCRFLKDHLELKPEVILIHSKNTVGQLYMKSLIPEAVIVSFLWLSCGPDILSDTMVEYYKHEAEHQSIRLDQYGKL